MTDEAVKAHCAKCGDDRKAAVVGCHKEEGDEEVWYSIKYRILKCLGCETVYFQTYSMCSEDYEITNEGEHELIPNVSYWPAPRRREMPIWLNRGLPIEVFYLLQEIYSAVEAGALRLVAMGIRSVLERVMIDRVEDQGSFTKSVDKLQEAGYLSIRQRNALDTMLEAGHAATHRAWHPSQEDINALLDVTEHVIKGIYIHEAQASGLEGKLPRRHRPV
jgi:hypothetical protein